MQSAGTMSHFFDSMPATAVAHSELTMLSLTPRSAAISFIISTSMPTYSPLGRGDISGRYRTPAIRSSPRCLISSSVLCACATSGNAHQNTLANMPTIAILRIEVLLGDEHVLRVAPGLLLIWAPVLSITAEREAASLLQP